MNLVKLLAFASVLFFSMANVFGQSDPYFMFGFRTGASYSPIGEFPVWAETEGLSNMPSSTNHRQLGFDLMIQGKKLPWYLTTEINLPELSKTTPYLTNFALESGFKIFDEKAKLYFFMGPSIGVMTVRFRQGTPDTFLNLPFDHSDAFARSYVLLVRSSLMATYPLYREAEKSHGFVLIFNAGINQRIAHSGFRYGENDWINDNRFISEPVDMPRFFKRNVWVSFGIGYKMNFQKI